MPRLKKKKTARKTAKMETSGRSFQKSYFKQLLFLLFIIGFLWVGETLTEVRLPQGDKPAELYSNQLRDDLKLTYSSAIRNAKKSIFLITYTLTDKRIIRDLTNKAEEGLDVRVVCDGKASYGAAELLGSKVKTTLRCGPGLMHQKILVIDEKQAWIGSANMTPSSLKMHGNLVMAVDAPDLAGALISKAKSMATFGRCLDYPHQTFSLGTQPLELLFLPDDNEAVSRLERLIDGATKTVRVAMFTFTHHDLAKALVAAHNRGIDIEVVIDKNSGHGTSEKIVKYLKKEGVPVYLSTGDGLLHHKFLYIDQETLVNGSANWTQSAFSKNDDCLTILHDLTKEQQNHMNRLWEVIQINSEDV